MNDIKSSGLFDIVAQAIEEMKQELGTLFSVEKMHPINRNNRCVFVQALDFYYN